MSLSLDRFSLAAGCIQEFAPPEQIQAAARAGFSQCGIWVDPDTWTDAVTREVLEVKHASGVQILDVEVIWIHAGETDPGLEAIIEVGGALGAGFGLVVSSDPDIEATRRRFTELCLHADKHNLALVLEFLPITEVKSLQAAVSVVESVGAPHGVLVDSLHLARTGSTPADLQVLPNALFPYLQICDGPAAHPGDDFESLVDDAINGRCLPGEGQLPVAELVNLFPDVPLSLEIRSAELRNRFPGIDQRAGEIWAGARRFAGAMGNR